MKPSFPRLTATASAVFVLALLAGVMIAARPASTEREPLHVLMITGGGWHDYPAQQEILSGALGQRVDVEFTIDFEGGEDSDAAIARHENADWAEEFDLVLYNMCYTGVTDQEWVNRIVQGHVAHQVPAVVLHCGMHSYNFDQDNPIWSVFLGVRTHRHQQPMPFTVEALEPDHPVMASFPSPWTTPEGELYEIVDIYPTATPLAHALGEDSGEYHVNVWTNEFAGVRVFGTTIGHHNETMETDAYLDLVASGLLWAAGRLDDEGQVLGYETR